jgi:hypothetical protein
VVANGILIAIYLFCVWHGITIEIGTKISFEIYPAKRLFNRETIHMNGKEYRAYIDSQTVTTAKEDDIFCGARDFTPEESERYNEALSKVYKPTGRNFFDEIKKDEEFYDNLKMAYKNESSEAI